MYREYYEFLRRPFEITPDPSFLYLGEAHREGLAIRPSSKFQCFERIPRPRGMLKPMRSALAVVNRPCKLCDHQGRFPFRKTRSCQPS